MCAADNTSSLPRLLLKRGRERSLHRRHPWVFSGAIKRLEGDPGRGATVMICRGDGKPLGRGAYSPGSQIAARIWTFDPGQEVDAHFFARRVQSAVALREQAGITTQTDALRLVNAESDGLPGVTVDRYGQQLVLQLSSAGADAWRGELVQALHNQLSCNGIFERSDSDSRRKEGLAPQSGTLWGSAPPPRLQVTEGPHRFWVDVTAGHKTGFYLDQRHSRARLGHYAAGADRLLNVFSYTGAFSVVALGAGARQVTSIEASAEANQLQRANLELNRIDPGRLEPVQGDAFVELRRLRDGDRSFDLVLLDPPKFVANRAQLERGARGYKDINLLGIKLTRPGGILLTFSCSGLVGADLLHKIVADAAGDAGRTVRVLERLVQPADHPVAIGFPEGLYLKGLLCQVA